MSKIVVSGALANKLGNGGSTWVRLSWFLGFRQLGLDTWFVEQIDPASCVDDRGNPSGFVESANLAYFRQVSEQFGFADRASLICGEGPRTWGLSLEELAELAADADLLVNISGHLTAGGLLHAFRHKVHVDLDPGYTQFWAAEGLTGARLADHDQFVTVGTNIGKPHCPIPTAGVRWHGVRQPVTLQHWPPVQATPDPFRLTTVGAWRGSYGRISHAGTTYGLKAHEFRKLVDLPDRVGGQFELALEIHPRDGSDIALLRRHGWHLVDPRGNAGSPDGFRDYVQGSAGEFSAAQGVYVETCSGWFSDRTARYLASGRPALVQDTGFDDLPVGDGLLTFRTIDEAEQAVREVRRNYDHHARAARELAEEHLDSDVVLSRLLADLGVGP